MTVKEIVEEYLRTHGFDGLVSADEGCSCEVGDIAPCDGETENFYGCKPAHKQSCDICPIAAIPWDDANACEIDDHPQRGGYCLRTEKVLAPTEPEVKP